jgi:hypothetical protein
VKPGIRREEKQEQDYQGRGRIGGNSQEREESGQDVLQS